MALTDMLKAPLRYRIERGGQLPQVEPQMSLCVARFYKKE